MEEKDRITLLLTAVQMFAPALTDKQVQVVISALFKELGVELPEAESTSSLVV